MLPVLLKAIKFEITSRNCFKEAEMLPQRSSLFSSGVGVRKAAEFLEFREEPFEYDDDFVAEEETASGDEEDDEAT